MMYICAKQWKPRTSRGGCNRHDGMTFYPFTTAVSRDWNGPSVMGNKAWMKHSIIFFGLLTLEVTTLLGFQKVGPTKFSPFAVTLTFSRAGLLSYNASMNSVFMTVGETCGPMGLGGTFLDNTLSSWWLEVLCLFATDNNNHHRLLLLLHHHHHHHKLISYLYPTAWPHLYPSSTCLAKKSEVSYIQEVVERPVPMHKVPRTLTLGIGWWNHGEWDGYLIRLIQCEDWSSHETVLR